MELRETKSLSPPKRQVKTLSLPETTFLEKLAAKAVLILSVIAVVILFMLLIRKVGVFETDKLRAFVEGAGVYAPLALMAIIVIGSISLSVPATPAIVLAGVLYGPLIGGLYAYIAILLAASIAFFISRYFRRYILKFLGKHAQLLVNFQERYVAYVIFFTRAIPFFHFEIVSYASGLTSVTYGAYIIATALGVLVPVLLFSVTGHALLHASGWLSIASAIVLVLALFIIPLAIDHYNPWGWKQKLLKNPEAKR